MTFISQTHGWRGFSTGRDIVDVMFVLGFVTFYVSRRPLLDRLVKMLQAERKLREEEKAKDTFAEMSCFGEDSAERGTNVLPFQNVSKRGK